VRSWEATGAAIFLAAIVAVILIVRLIGLARFASIPVLLAAAWGAISLWQNTHLPEARGLKPAGVRNLVIITIDALRADAVEPYGVRWRTPAFAELAARSIVYESAYAASPWTMPSLASMLSGLNPRAHGCTEPERCLAPQVNSLAELLNNSGFDTAAVIYQGLFMVHTGFERGFNRYSVMTCHPVELYRTYFAPVSRIPERLLDGYPHLTVLTTIEALRTLASLRQPFFLWVHYFDPHSPYAPPRRLMRLVNKPALPVKLPGHPSDQPASVDSAVLQKHASSSPPPKPHEIEYVRQMYQAEVAFADEQIARFTEFLETSGLVSNTYLILSSDHGEEFYEHGGWDHGHSLYNEVLQIPLMLSGPGISPELAVCPATHTDIFVTSLKLVGVKPPFSHGTDLLELAGQQDCRSRTIVCSTAFVMRKEQDAIYRWPYKLINPPMELYRIDRDPLEQERCEGDEIDLALELKRAMHERIAADYRLYKKLGIKPLAKDEKKLQQEVLKALGYVE
ncbi:MAG TPA: hypothetical protein ENF73_01085, partial [Proteobacteria bacterium]|nr:hypothetical protein [Pseudomonadota bacterium]